MKKRIFQILYLVMFAFEVIAVIILLKYKYITNNLLSFLMGIISSIIATYSIYLFKSVSNTTRKIIANIGWIKPEEISHKNDFFVHETITTRFEDIYKRTKLDSYEKVRNEPVNFTERDFKEIISNQDSSKSNSCRQELTINFLNIMKKYSGIKIGYFNTIAPFIIVEHFFYFDLLKRKKQKNNSYRDPFADIKREKLEEETTKEAINSAVMEYAQRLNHTDLNYIDVISDLLLETLYSNSSDLSQRPGRLQGVDENNGILINDSIAAAQYLLEKKLTRIDLIVDNTGLELITDILLVLTLLKMKIVDKIYIHLNILPIFVSDTIQSEYGDDIELVLSKMDESMMDKSISSEFRDHIRRGNIMLAPHLFWNMPDCFSDFPDEIKTSLKESGLLIIKGDLNYRRLVEDRKWNHNKSIKKVIKKIELPVLIIRSLKSNIILDIPFELEKKTKEIDPFWLTNGKYGIIQFVRL